MKFRAGVYANRGRISAGCQVLLLRLSDDMSANAIVSIPRSRLAEEFDVPPARITEWIGQAKEAGFLSIVRRARPKVTAVYQGLEVRRGVPHQRYGTPTPTQVRPAAPLTEVQRYAQHLPQEVVGTAGRERLTRVRSSDAGSDERSAS